MASGESSSSLSKFSQLLNGYLPGKLAANPWVLLGLTPLIIFFGMEAYYPKANGDVAYVVTIIVIAHLVTSVTAVLLNVLVIRFFMIRSVVLLLLTYVLAGIMDSLVLIIGFDVPWIPIGSGLSAWSLLTVAALVTSAWLLMGHLALGLLIGNVRAYSQLQASNAELLAMNNTVQAELRNYKDSLRGAITERIEKVLNQIASQLSSLTGTTDPKLLLATAANVRDLSEKVVRRLSHELSESAGESYNPPKLKRKFSWIGFVKFGGDASANIPWVLSVGTLQAISLALAIGSFETTLVVVIALLIGFPFLVFVDRHRRKLVEHSPLWLQIISAPIEYLVLALIGVRIVSLIAKDFGDLYLHINTFMVAVPTGAISIWFLIFLIRGFSSTYAERTKQLVAVSKELLDSLVAERIELATVRNKLARVLHGSVQGRLASVSLALTATATASDSNDATEMISRAKAQLELAKSDLLEAFDDSPSEGIDFESQLQALLSGWQGLVDIVLNISDDCRANLQAKPHLATKVVEAMQECLTNSVRHGSGRQVSFEFTQADSQLTMVAVNAGEIQEMPVTLGLGWQQMQAGADSIDIKSGDGRFELQITWAY